MNFYLLKLEADLRQNSIKMNDNDRENLIEKLCKNRN